MSKQGIINLSEFIQAQLEIKDEIEGDIKDEYISYYLQRLINLIDRDKNKKIKNWFQSFITFSAYEIFPKKDVGVGFRIVENIFQMILHKNDESDEILNTFILVKGRLITFIFAFKHDGETELYKTSILNK